MKFLNVMYNIMAVCGWIYLLFIMIPKLISSSDAYEFGLGLFLSLLCLTTFVIISIDFYNEYFSKKVKKND